jgi:hypothetical protein
MHLRLFSDFSHKHFVTYSQSVLKEHRTPQACRSAPRGPRFDPRAEGDGGNCPRQANGLRSELSFLRPVDGSMIRSVLGELERRAGNLPRARQHLERALEAAPTHAEKALLGRRLAACDAPDESPPG